MSWLAGSCPLPIKYCLAATPTVFKRRLREIGCKEDYPNSDASTMFFVNAVGRHTAIVTLRVTTQSGIQIAALLCHEAVHIWQQAREIMGEKTPSSEFEAYSIQRIAQDLMEQYCEQSHTATD
jgi:hypothetical protein